MSVQIIQCDARALPLADESVDCCVTSPPYYGLRDYGMGGQIGLEKTPDEYVAQIVAAMRDVRRVLKPAGTLWLNLGDSYAAQRGGTHQPAETLAGGRGGRTSEGERVNRDRHDGYNPSRNASAIGLKHKDLIGIPWMVARALRDPYYTGTVRDERDRVWLAAMLDAEGCIFIHRRKAGQSNGQGYERKQDSFGSGVEIANTSIAVVERVLALVGRGSISSQGPEQNGRRKQTIYRWNLRTNECRDFLREVYPYLVAKKQQARIAIGCPSSGGIAAQAHAALIGLHHGLPTSVDFAEPASLLEPGWYLRSDIIWSKANPMPESVTGRPTKAHEYVFLLAKSERYHYDAAAVAEPAVDPESIKGKRPRKSDHVQSDDGYDGHRTRVGLMGSQAPRSTRNRRTVWTVPTKPYSGAHFATMPEALAEPCILAGCPEGGTVLDPFAGSGTIGRVAVKHRRKAILCDLNPTYLRDLADARTRDVQVEMPMRAKP